MILSNNNNNQFSYKNGVSYYDSEAIELDSLEAEPISDEVCEKVFNNHKKILLPKMCFN